MNKTIFTVLLSVTEVEIKIQVRAKSKYICAIDVSSMILLVTFY